MGRGTIATAGLLAAAAAAAVLVLAEAGPVTRDEQNAVTAQHVVLQAGLPAGVVAGPRRSR